MAPKLSTNELTQAILLFLFNHHIFAYRQNSTGIFDPKINRFRSSAKRGVSDIIAILPPNGKFLGIEIKTGKDRLSSEQKGFICNVLKMGGYILVVKDFDDFIYQWNEISKL